MSDYVHEKAIMYPLPEKQHKEWDDDPVEFERKFPKTDEGKFEIAGTIDYENDNSNDNYYLSFVLYSNYGDDSADFGRSRFLTKKEREKYAYLFEEIIPDLDPEKLKLVEYCYYNCCECQDYYVLEDEFYKEV